MKTHHTALLEPYFDAEGKKLLGEQLKRQSLCCDDYYIAELFAAKTELRQLEPGELLIRKDDADSDLYFILQGSIDVLIDERRIAQREAGQYIGEMTLTNPNLRRTATTIAHEPTVVAKVSEEAFSKIALAYPKVWRALAIDLTARLEALQRLFTHG